MSRLSVKHTASFVLRYSGKAQRKVIGNSMARQHASAVILRDNQILMVRMMDKDRSWWLVRELWEELRLSVEPGQRLYSAAMPYDEGTDSGFLIDSPVGPPRIGIDPLVTHWAWRRLDEANNSWQVRKVKNVLAFWVEKSGREAGAIQSLWGTDFHYVIIGERIDVYLRGGNSTEMLP
jgi:hypothetical protein